MSKRRKMFNQMPPVTKAPTLNLDVVEHKRRSPHHAVTDFQAFAETETALELTTTELSRKLGYSDSAARMWRDKDKMPVVAAMACRWLRVGKEAEKSLLLVQLSDGKLELVQGEAKMSPVPSFSNLWVIEQ